MCDVIGHGIRAALVAAMMRTPEEQLNHLKGEPIALLTQMNRSLRRILGLIGVEIVRLKTDIRKLDRQTTPSKGESCVPCEQAPHRPARMLRDERVLI